MTIDYSHAHELMVEQQIRPWDVLEIRVLDVLARLPREAFVAESHRALAYADIELPLGNGQKMMKPVIEGRTLQALDLQPGDEVLEIGTGSGYLSACMGELAREVLSLEIDADLATTAGAPATTTVTSPIFASPPAHPASSGSGPRRTSS